VNFHPLFRLVVWPISVMQMRKVVLCFCCSLDSFGIFAELVDDVNENLGELELNLIH
jgi:hypothetical protein